ncbi:heat shock protein 30 [Cercophora newfieldiana]|uniref:Heat shock protein 30 n=1 Tax=Cercophora newfieldiana TaxID=92897 RepID=A0AA39YRG7_9PEZI|nr:heat shock protein 30 [Cercophora newfieldiana]
MSTLLPRGFYGYGSADPGFTSLFRFLDDFDTYNRESQSTGQQDGSHRRQANRVFSPKFDIRETETAYELYGELPGINREQVSIEFTDPQTIVIRGRVERSYSSGTPSTSGAITEKGESHHAPHKVTVEDEDSEKAKEQDETQVVKKSAQAHLAKPAPNEKYWVSERSVGEFLRTFSFPTRVDQDAVKAGLEQGVLSIVVPKARKHESRRIAIN